ncbi:MAG: 3 terminal ribose 2-O-methyltransferase Hen1 [Clostridiaceae bacterium]|jgi:3' terminal RNA ribose 2'-O-methyltransferase Hen1|nr:3 terminal ribose 2-O-methyltransferase Hen1 [Clostridiaceae bacterium]
MFLKINAKGNNANLLSYVYGKNPNKVFVNSERAVAVDVDYKIKDLLKNGEVSLNIKTLSKDLIKLLKKDRVINEKLEVINENTQVKYITSNGELIRKKVGEIIDTFFFYKKYTETEVEAVLYSLPDTLAFAKDFNGYVNEKEYLATSVFQKEIMNVLNTSLNKEGDIYENEYDIQLEVGPFKPKLTNENIIKMYEELGYKVAIEEFNEPVSFTSRRKEICFIKLEKTGKVRDILRELIVTITAIDNFRHFKPEKQDLEKFKRYTEGWLDTHSMRKVITQRYLSYSTYATELLNEIEEKNKQINQINNEIEIEEVVDKGYGENGLKLNTLRLIKVKEAILETKCKKVLDFGCGEGNLIDKLVYENLEITGVDSNADIIYKAKNRFRGNKFNNITLLQSSLYYRDSRLKGFDTIVLCEVIEHNELERIPGIIDNVMYLEPKNLIISTPNIEFNKFFNSSNRLRHYDHRFEFTKNEFMSFCENISKTYGYDYKVSSFGKVIDDIQPTMMAVFTKLNI